MLVSAVAFGIATTRPQDFPSWFGMLLLLGIGLLGLLVSARRWRRRRNRG